MASDAVEWTDGLTVRISVGPMGVLVQVVREDGPGANLKLSEVVGQAGEHIGHDGPEVIAELARERVTVRA